MVDLRFATPVERKKFTCASCHEVIRRGRKCDEPGYKNLARMDVGPGSLAYTFCPGKATWSAEAARLFEECRVTLETGIMPKGQHLDDQDEYFSEALPVFICRWRERNYQRVWADVIDHTNRVLKAVLGDK